MTKSQWDLLAAVPIKPFGVAKRRLSPILDAGTRSRLGKAVALRTVRIIDEAGAHPVVVTADDGVTEWATSHGIETIIDPGAGLNAAAATVVSAARGQDLRWALVHADLPCVTPGELRAVFAALPERGVVISPAHDGGTNVMAGDVDRFRFGYGTSSYHRHLRAAVGLPRRIVTRWGLALDLDAPADLARARATRRGLWLGEVVEDRGDPPSPAADGR
jgi:2-phospho-L-lactate guanylyltransferase